MREIGRLNIEQEISSVDVHKVRQRRLRKLLSRQGFDAVLISNHKNIEYFTGFAGLLPEEDRESYLLITASNIYLFTTEMYFGQAKRLLKENQVLKISEFLDQLKDIAEREGFDNLGIEEDDLTVREYKMLNGGDEGAEDLPAQKIREIKDEREVKQLREVSHATDKAFELILPYIKAGVTELELREQLEDCIKELGYDVGFKAIVAFGANTIDLHHLTDDTALEKNNFVLFDFGLKGKEGYVSDMSRTVFFGKPTEEQVRQYETVRKAQQAVIDRLNDFYSNPENAGKTMLANDVDAIARDYIKQAGYPNIPYPLGHGVGLSVHEGPVLASGCRDPLVKNMVFTIEPGIYTGLGGVRIEDVILINDNGIEVFNQSPKNLRIIPAN